MSHIPSLESPQAPRSRLWPQPLQMAASTTERQLRFFFFFYPALGCNWIQTETTTSAPGKEGIGAGAEGACGRREGPEERAREGSPSSSQTKQKKDQKTGKRGRANRRFQEQSPHLQEDSALGIQIQCLRKTKGAPREWRCDPRAWAPTRSPHGPAARTVADHVSRPTTRPQSAAPPARARLRARLPQLCPKQLQPRSK